MNITAVLSKKKLGVRWGFSFNTGDMACVETFMFRLHVPYNQYTLFFNDSAPDGVYTDVVSLPVYMQGRVIDWKFVL